MPVEVGLWDLPIFFLVFRTTRGRELPRWGDGQFWSSNSGWHLTYDGEEAVGSNPWVVGRDGSQRTLPQPSSNRASR